MEELYFKAMFNADISTWFSLLLLLTKTKLHLWEEHHALNKNQDNITL
jgi:hypothetical protein